eukprot:scaffold63204_cov70-Cyclotella_meneghiniana.AAC.1
MDSDDFQHANCEIIVGMIPLLQDRQSKIGRASDTMKDRSITAHVALGLEDTIDIEIENGILC